MRVYVTIALIAALLSLTSCGGEAETQRHARIARQESFLPQGATVVWWGERGGWFIFQFGSNRYLCHRWHSGAANGQGYMALVEYDGPIPPARKKPLSTGGCAGEADKPPAPKTSSEICDEIIEANAQYRLEIARQTHKLPRQY